MHMQAAILAVGITVNVHHFPLYCRPVIASIMFMSKCECSVTTEAQYEAVPSSH